MRIRVPEWIKSLVLALITVGVVLTAPGMAAQVRVNPTSPELGNTLSVVLESPTSATPKVTWQGKTYPMFAIGPNRVRALLPTTPLDQPGAKPLQINDGTQLQTLTYVEPIRDIFAALFFVAVGMLIDPIFLWEHLELIIGLMLLIVAGKTLIIIPIVKLFGYSWRTSIITGLGLAQIGEFSFVLASAGQGLGLVSRRVYLLIVGTTALTLIITPFILQ